MNEVKLQGQITSDPEVKESRNGILRGSFLLTTKGGTEDRPRYDYIRCVIWDEKAQYVVDHFEKGQSVSIREFDSCLQFFTNQIAQNIDYINAFEFFYCQIRENKCTNMS